MLGAKALVQGLECAEWAAVWLPASREEGQKYRAAGGYPLLTFSTKV